MSLSSKRMFARDALQGRDCEALAMMTTPRFPVVGGQEKGSSLLQHTERRTHTQQPAITTASHSFHHRHHHPSDTTATMAESSHDITNPRGIPTAPFVEDVEAFVDSRADIEPNLKKFQEMIAKYQFMEMNTQRRAAGLKDKIPDIQKTLDTVTFLESRSDSSKAIDATFELNDTLYAKAKINATDEVYLWLGANVMLSYPVDEARKLLTGKLMAAKESLGNCEEDLDFLRQQITTLEVNTARLYNYEVTLKRKEKEEAEKAAEEDK